MSSWGVQEIIAVIGVFTLLIVVVGVAVWHVGVSWRARAVLARQNSYRDLAERSLQAQESTQMALNEIVVRFTELQKRVDSVERILKEIE